MDLLPTGGTAAGDPDAAEAEALCSGEAGNLIGVRAFSGTRESESWWGGCTATVGRDIERQLITDHLNLLAAKATNPACAVNEALQVCGVVRASDYIEFRASVARFFACKGAELTDALVEKIVWTPAPQKWTDVPGQQRPMPL